MVNEWLLSSGSDRNIAAVPTLLCVSVIFLEPFLLPCCTLEILCIGNQLG
jgi:hypothetical protein